MKTKYNVLTKISLISGCALALAFAIGCATNSTTGNQMKPMKAGEHQLMLNKIETAQDFAALQNDDTVAMVCAKCKTVWISRVKQGVKGAEIMMAGGQSKELIGTHACAGCKSTITVTGHAKGDITELKHSCAACGDDSAFCCATKSRSGATEGMEK